MSFVAGSVTRLTGPAPKLPKIVIPFALQISAVPEEASGCAAPHLTLGEGPRAYRDVFTASYDGRPGAEF